MALDYYYTGLIDLSTLAQTVTVGVACRVGDVHLTRLLLEARFGRFSDDRGWFPMHEAAFGLHTECCRVLCESGLRFLSILLYFFIVFILIFNCFMQKLPFRFFGRCCHRFIGFDSSFLFILFGGSYYVKIVKFTGGLL